MHTQHATALGKYTEVSIRRLASFDVRAFTVISPDSSGHPTNHRGERIPCV
ncbi:hypothetical protein AVEN_71300-1, partial [Araneus ventricosus]